MSVTPLRLAGLPAAPLARFCGHCGRPPEDPAQEGRVCERCRLGLILQAPESAAPKASEPFLVVDRTLSVCALSRKAERLLGVTETQAVNRRLTELLLPADTETGAARSLAELVAVAAGGAHHGPASVVVRPADEFGVRFRARIGPCGPSAGALVVLGDVA